jgi:hypothetical protein
MEFSFPQVQAIGLQVLKSSVQKATIEDNAFVIFLVGEHIGDILTIIQDTLKVFFCVVIFLINQSNNPSTCSTSVFYNSNKFVQCY